MRNMKLTPFIMFLFALNAHGIECKNIGEQLSIDEPKVKSFIQQLEPSEISKGIQLCDNTVMFQNWKFLHRVSTSDSLQHIYLFEYNGSKKAVAWVNKNGHAFEVPACAHGEKCKQIPLGGALVISGDVYTWKKVRPGKEVVIIWYPPKSW